MALTSYAGLKAAIADWLARSDLTTVIDDFIDLAEARINRELRIKPMETALSVTISSGVAAVPTGYQELRFAYVDGTPTQYLQMKDPEWIYRHYATRSSDGKPEFIAREGSNFIFGPYPDSGYTIKGIYYKAFTPLGDGTGGTVTTNWFTTDAPDLILYGALLESAPYLGDDDRLTLWGARFREAMERVKVQDKKERYPSGMSIAITAA